MTINQTLAEILDETIKALRDLDSDALQALEQRIVALAKSRQQYQRDDGGLILLKKGSLEIILQNCRVNLDALTRLHARNMRNQWAQ